MWEVLTEQKPFSGKSDVEVEVLIRDKTRPEADRRPSVALLPDTLPRLPHLDLRDLTQRCWSQGYDLN